MRWLGKQAKRKLTNMTENPKAQPLFEVDPYGKTPEELGHEIYLALRAYYQSTGELPPDDESK